MSLAREVGGKRSAQIAVVWFKVTDLRTHDHEPLCQAHASGLPVLHLFVLDPRWYRRTPLCDFPRTGSLRARFQLEALADLAGRLDAEGHKLCVRRGRTTAEVFEELCDDFCVAAVYASREVCSEELRVEQGVREVLRRRGAGDLRLFWSFELHHYDDLPEDLRRHGSNSYSGYKRVFQGGRCRPRQPLAAPPMRQSAPGARWARAEALPADVTELGLPPAPRPEPRAELSWVGGETAALARVQDYLFGTDALALSYVGSTNTPRQGNSCTKEGSMSRLSPWLAHGCLSARTLYFEIKRYERQRHKSDSTYWLVHELYWRDFVRFGSLLAGNKIFKIGGLYNKHPDWPWSQSRDLLEPWLSGTTGFPFADAALREIQATGYSCHVGRETAAWFLICDLGLDWRMGAEWFESVLIDYEPAANWFCWVFVCLIRATGGNGFREIGHPEFPPRTRLQSAEVVFLSAQHDPDGEYIKRWVPELQDLPPGLLVREPWRAVGEPEVALQRGVRSQHGRSPVGPDRIQMARRTLASGGASVAVWRSCVRDKGVRPVAPEALLWPRGYPLPMFPPASFFDIEKVADKARRQQAQKAARVAALRRELGKPGFVRALPSAAGGALDEEDEDPPDGTPGSAGGYSRTGAKGGGRAPKGAGKGDGGGPGRRWASAANHDARPDPLSHRSEQRPDADVQKKRRWGAAASRQIVVDDKLAGM